MKPVWKFGVEKNFETESIGSDHYQFWNENQKSWIDWSNLSLL